MTVDAQSRYLSESSSLSADARQQFFFIEALNLEFPPEDDVRIRAHDGLYDDLLVDFERVRKEKKRDEADYAVVNVSPSVVPNPLLPSFRVFSYNITGAEHLDADSALKKNKRKKNHASEHN